MDSIIPIGEKVFWVGCNDRETDLFEGIWPLPHGVAYNAYLILDEKTVQIDTVKGLDTGPFLSRLKSCLQGRPLDYLVVNHLEPDHSGSLRALREIYPNAQIVGNKKTAEYLSHLCKVTDGVRVIEDGESLPIGNRTLKFHLVPMVHWPETMVTYDEREQILFSCDAFGSFGAHDSGIFDDQADEHLGHDEMLRYYSNIVGKYSPMVQKALAKLQGIPVRTIAPSHGPIWRKNPAEVLQRYDRWSRYEAEPGVVLAYGSMYGNSRKMMEAVAEGIGRITRVPLAIHDVSRSHLSFMLRDAWRYQAIILCSPAYDTKLYPPMADLIDRLERKGLKNRIAGICGTFGWSGGGVSALKEFVQRIGWELLEPVLEARFSPSPSDLDACRLLGENLAKKIGV